MKKCILILLVTTLSSSCMEGSLVTTPTLHIQDKQDIEVGVTQQPDIQSEATPLIPSVNHSIIQEEQNSKKERSLMGGLTMGLTIFVIWSIGFWTGVLATEI